MIWRIWKRSAVIVHLAAVSPAAMAAQSMPYVSGTVVDASGAAVFGAEVSVGIASARTDESGHFNLVPQQGVSVVRVRRLGFEPLTAQVPAAMGEDGIRLVLEPLTALLAPVVVRSERPRYSGRLTGYYQRLERRNSGTFISRDQIDRENPRALSQLLTHVPGVNATRMGAGGGGVRMRGRACWPLVWLDGLPMGSGEVDLDAIPPHTIHGIELYLGATTAPLRYIGPRSQSSCGTILLWSRGPDTDPVRWPARPRFDLEQMVASLAIFTRDSVDEPATPMSPEQLRIQYPPEMYASGEGGSVVAEFVVDEMGKVEPGSFGIVSSTDVRLSEAVRVTVASAAFWPAVKRGRAVRQLVQQPFAFPARAS
ncbi:MAG: TonB family protein [Gemmatimonadaceae bacterium]